MARVGGALTIGRDVELAAQVGAAGVQLGDAAAVAPARARLGRGALLGVSAHSLAEVRAAREAGADYVTLSPIFLTASKPGYGPALGLEVLREATEVMSVVALGGIDATRMHTCRAAGVCAVAVMGLVMRAVDVESVLNDLGANNDIFDRRRRKLIIIIKSFAYQFMHQHNFPKSII